MMCDTYDQNEPKFNEKFITDENCVYLPVESPVHLYFQDAPILRWQLLFLVQ